MARILLVDRDRGNRALLGALLQRAGHAVVYAEEASAALAIVSLGAVDMVVTDMVASDAQGPRLIRKITETADTPVIALSGENPAHRILAKEYGAFETIRKPVDVRVLLDAVDRADGRMVFPFDGVWH